MLKRFTGIALTVCGVLGGFHSATHAQEASDVVLMYCEPDIANGFARCNTPAGDNYLGYLQNGKPSGRGVYIYSNGDRYEGEWSNGVPNGEGRFVFADDARYEGRFQNGQIVEGSAIYTNGDRYTGTFEVVQYADSGLLTSQPSGRGSLIFSNGNRYDGEFFAGVPFGRGKFTHTTGTVCEGYFLNLNFDAHEATCSYPNGSRYRGELRLARPHGTGTMTLPNGTQVSGAFRDGQPVSFSGY